MTSTITALPFFGGELSTFDPFDNNTIEVTTGGTFDSTKSRCSIAVGTGSSFSSPKWSDAATFWVHGQVYLGGINNFFGEIPIFDLFTNSGTLVARVTTTVLNSVVQTVKLYTLQGGVMTLLGSVTYAGGVLTAMDAMFVAGASGQAALYLAGSISLGPFTGLNHAAWSGIGRIFCGPSPGVGNFNYFSQIIGKATPTVGNFVITDNLDTESGSPNDAWTGGVSDINEIVLNDATFIYTNTANDINTFYDSTLDLGTYSVLARGVASRTRVQDAGPTGCQLVLNSGGTNYFSTTKTLTPGFEALFNSWTVNPNGSVAWTAGAAETTRGGVKAIA